MKQHQEGNKEVQVKPPVNAMAVLPEDDFSSLPSAEAGDYKIPVLTVIQPTSSLDGFTPGDVLDSNTKQILFKANESVNFVPLWFYKDFAVYEYTNGQRGKYVRREDRTPKNSHLEQFDNRVQAEDGRQVMYMVRTCFFVILEKDLNQPMPQIYLLRYKGASLGEGKNAIMCWDRAIRTKTRPYSMVMSVTPKMEKNEKGKFIVLHTANVLENNQAKQLQGDLLVTAYNWHKVILENREAMANRAAEDIDETRTVVSDAKFEENKLNY